MKPKKLDADDWCMLLTILFVIIQVLLWLGCVACVAWVIYHFAHKYW